MMALSCQCVSFMPSLFSNFLNSPSLISPQCSSASSLSSPFHLEHWHPPSPSSSVIVFHRRRMTESASRFSHHTKTSCQLLLLISSKCATSRPPSPAHFIAKLSSCSLFFLSFLLWFHCGLWTRHKVGAVVFFPLILDILVWRLIITIGCPHSSPSLPSSQRTWSHFSYQHCLNTWTFFFIFYFFTQNSKALHDLHWATLCFKEKICWQFKDVTVWIIGVASDHRNNKAVFSYFGCLLSTNLGFSCACVYLVCSVGGVWQVNCHGNI